MKFMLSLLWALSSLIAVGQKVEPETVRPLIQESLALLERSVDRSYHQQNCFTCHHSGTAVRILNEAIQHRFVVNEDLLLRQMQRAYERLAHNIPRFTKGNFERGKADVLGLCLLVLGEAGYPPDAVTDNGVDFLLTHDNRQDYWTSERVRPPLEGSDFTATLRVVRALKLHQAESSSKRLTGVKKWVLTHPASDTEDQVSRLRLLREMDAPAKAIKEATEQLLAGQRNDGGWGQAAFLNSDPYATGSVLATLVESGDINTSYPAWQQGAKFLMDTREHDGSWHVKSRVRKVRPHYESGFPHGGDQFVSTSASARAIQALLYMFPKQDPAKPFLAGRKFKTTYSQE